MWNMISKKGNLDLKKIYGNLYTYLMVKKIKTDIIYIMGNLVFMGRY